MGNAWYRCPLEVWPHPLPSLNPMPGLTDPSPSCLRASPSHCRVTGRSHLALAPWRAFAGWLPRTPRHWEPVARAGPVSPAPYQGHCSTAGTKSGVDRGRCTASLLSSGVRGAPFLGELGRACLGSPWAGLLPASGTPSFVGSHPRHRGCHCRPPPALLSCDMRDGGAQGRDTLPPIFVGP